jgi:hypothetical protein
LFLDESAANERTCDRKYGWAPISTPAKLIAPFKRSEKYSILPLYGMNGFITWRIIQKSFNAEMFLEFLEDDVLPLCNPFPGSNSVLIMDNARIHRDDVHYFPLRLG